MQQGRLKARQRGVQPNVHANTQPDSPPASTQQHPHRRHLPARRILGHSVQLIGAPLHIGLHQHTVFGGVVGQGAGACGIEGEKVGMVMLA